MPATAFSPALPCGPLPLASPFYIQRLKAQTDCYAAIDHPGALIRIKGARRTGKTSLMARLAQQATQRGYQLVTISFQLADKPVLQNLDQLLQWFCASVGLGLGLAPKMETYWDPLFGSKVSCKIYFEQYLLSLSDRHKHLKNGLRKLSDNRYSQLSTYADKITLNCRATAL